jgi:hypothetical protein
LKQAELLKRQNEKRGFAPTAYFPDTIFVHFNIIHFTLKISTLTPEIILNIDTEDSLEERKKIMRNNNFKAQFIAWVAFAIMSTTILGISRPTPQSPEQVIKNVMGRHSVPTSFQELD